MDAVGEHAIVTFRTPGAADEARRALGTSDDGNATACPFFNERSYDERGWTSFERGVARLVAAHLRHAATKLGKLPFRRSWRAGAPKVVDLARASAAAELGDPGAELAAAQAVGAMFTGGKEDHDRVHRMLEWVGGVVPKNLEVGGTRGERCRRRRQGRRRRGRGGL